MESKDTEDNEPTTLSRRQFMQHLGAVGVVALAGALGQRGHRVEPTLAASVKQTKAESGSADEPGYKPVSSEQLYGFLTRSRYYPPHERELEAAIESYRKQPNFLEAAERISKSYGGLIYQAAKEIEAHTKWTIEPVWIEVMKGLIMVESSGWPEQVGPTGDMGLTQLNEAAVEDTKAILGIKGTVDLFNPKDNILLGFTYLVSNSQKFKQEPIATIGSYHLGVKGMSETIRTTGSAWNPYFLSVAAAALAIRTQTTARP